MSQANIRCQILEELGKGEWTFNLTFPIFIQKINSSTSYSEEQVREQLTHQKVMQCFLKSDFDSDLTEVDDRLVNPKPIKGGIISNKIKQCFGESVEWIAPQENHHAAIKGALREVQSNEPRSYYTFEKYVDGVGILKNSSFRSGTHPHLWGLIFIDEKQLGVAPEKLGLSIIHEMAHLELYLLNSIDRLIEVGKEKQALFSPFQNRMRPPLGLLHSAHALYRMHESNLSTKEEKSHFKDLLNQTVKLLDESCLTKFSQIMLQKIEKAL